MSSLNAVLRVSEDAVEFVWVGGMGGVGGVCKVIFVFNPTTVLRLCYVVLGLGLSQCNLLFFVTIIVISY